MRSSTAFLALLSLTAATPTLNRRAADTQNDLTNGGACKAMTVIFARGTAEPGNVGSLAGPPFFTALDQKLGAANVSVQGVEYPADIPGFLAGGDAGGSVAMAKLVATAMAKCPDTKIVMAGYSQGGQLVHNAAKLMSAAQTKAVSAAVIFGDPDNGDAVGSVPAAKTEVICHAGDNICQHGDLILAPHLTYGKDAGTAAAFVAGAAGM